METNLEGTDLTGWLIYGVSAKIRHAIDTITSRKATITKFLAQNVAAGSIIYTDGLKSFAGLEEAGFKHFARTQPLRTELLLLSF